MDHYYLTDEEQQLLDDYESGNLKPVPNQKAELERLRQIAKHTLNKTRNINIRLSERDLYKLKAKAIEEGIPYQTLASSILHKAATK
jgi:predicted DNA binding CopG/RHH family protein